MLKRSCTGVVFALLLLLVVAVSAAINYTNLGESSLFSDEAIYAVPAHNAITQHQWYPLIYQDTSYTWKPPLAVWPVAASFLVFGESAFADRAFSAAAAVLVTALVFACAGRMLGMGYGLFAAVLLASCPLWFGGHGSRQGVADPLLCLLLMLALVCYQRWREHGSRAALLVAAVAVALSALCKGLVAPLFVCAAVVCNELACRYASATLDERVRRSTLWAVMRIPLLLAASGCSLYLIWVWDNSMRNPEFWSHLYHDVVTRNVYGLHPSHVPGATFYAQTLVQALGYAELMLACLGAVWAWCAPACAEQRALRLTSIWIVAVIALIHCSVSKLSWYLDPALPALAIMIAAGVRALVEWFPADRRYAVTLAALLCAWSGADRSWRAWVSIHDSPRKIDMDTFVTAINQLPEARFYSEDFDNPPTRSLTGWNTYFREWNEYYLDQLQARTQRIPDRLQPGGCDVVLTDRAHQRAGQAGFEHAIVVPLRKYDGREADLAVLDLCQGRIASQLRDS
jgi:4-amino-4-deoxy-L-arabinose transferase-like glycosyltransferase